MTTTTTKTTEQWVNYISQKELPAIASTVKLLDKFSNDDKSSLPKLSEGILHDQALSSCILKVANSTPHIGHSKVTTISRATVILGIQTVKNICLTAKLINALFESNKLTPNSYYKLSKLMANSFYAGVLAKMLVNDYSEETQEEVYLAAMLYNIGETAFWSLGGELTEKIIQNEHLPVDEFNLYCEEHIGSTFTDISIGLAKSWNLGSLLEKSLDQPECRTQEIKLIYLANKLSNYIAKPPATIEEFDELINEISLIKKVTPLQLKKQIANTREHAITLLNSYGASILEENIKPLPTMSNFTQSTPSLDTQIITAEQAQLNTIHQLIKLTKSSQDINELFKYTLKSIADIFAFKQTRLYILTHDKNTLQARFSYHLEKKHEHISHRISVENKQNIMSYVMQIDTSLIIRDQHDKKWLSYITKDIAELIAQGKMCIFPVLINNQPIGVIIGQIFSPQENISKQDFEQCNLIIEHLNLCLSLISSNKAH